MKYISLVLLAVFCACGHPKDNFGREYEVQEIEVSGHWHDYVSYILVGKVMSPMHHHDWVVDTYTLDTIYYETRRVIGKQIYRK